MSRLRTLALLTTLLLVTSGCSVDKLFDSSAPDETTAGVGPGPKWGGGSAGDQFSYEWLRADVPSEYTLISAQASKSYLYALYHHTTQQRSIIAWLDWQTRQWDRSEFDYEVSGISVEPTSTSWGDAISWCSAVSPPCPRISFLGGGDLDISPLVNQFAGFGRWSLVGSNWGPGQGAGSIWVTDDWNRSSRPILRRWSASVPVRWDSVGVVEGVVRDLWGGPRSSGVMWAVTNHDVVAVSTAAVAPAGLPTGFLPPFRGSFDEQNGDLYLTWGGSLYRLRVSAGGHQVEHTHLTELHPVMSSAVWVAVDGDFLFTSGGAVFTKQGSLHGSWIGRVSPANADAVLASTIGSALWVFRSPQRYMVAHIMDPASVLGGSPRSDWVLVPERLVTPWVHPTGVSADGS